METMRCGRKISLVLWNKWRTIALLAVVAFSLAVAEVAFGAGVELTWQGGVAVAGKQETRAALVDSQGDLVLAGFGDSSVGEGRIAKLRRGSSEPIWTAAFNLDGGIDMATAVAVDGHDDVLVTGYGHNGSNYDVFTAKYAAADGSLLWSHAYRRPADGGGFGDGFGSALAVDALNNVYVGGQVQGSNGKEDALLIKYGPNGPNPDGTPHWVRTWDGAANGHDQILALTTGVDGLAVTGQSQNATPDYDAIALKYSFSGDLLWEKIYVDACDGSGRAVQMDPAGNVIMAGCVNNGSNRDLYVAKHPAAGGAPLWEKIVDYGFDDVANALWIDGAGDVYVTGSVYTSATAQDAFTLKLAGASGAELWRAPYNSFDGNREFGVALVVDEEGDLFVAGYQYDAITQKDSFLTLKYGKNSGNLLWAQTFDGVGQNNRAVGIGLAPDSTVLVAGWSDRWTNGSSDYDFYAVAYDPGAVNPPTSLHAQVVTNTEISLDWTDNSELEDGFVVERRIGDTGVFTPIATLGADTVSYPDTGLTPDTRYVYRVKAVSVAAGDSHYSNLAAVKTTVIEEQTPSWLYRYDGVDHGDDYAAAIAIGVDNHPVVTGASFAQEGAFDYLTVKIDRADAAKLWEARYNDPDFESDYATSVAVDGTNRVIVTGYASLYDGGAGNTNDINTIGYPASGPPGSWGDQYNGPHGSDDRSAAVSVATDGSDNVVVIGYGKNAAWNDDIYVLKYQPNGSRTWAAVPYDGGGHDYPAAVAFDPAGDIYVVGRTHNGSNYDMFIAKYARDSGSRLWTRTYTGPGVGNDYAEALAIDAAGNLYVAGYAINAAGQGVACLLKYDPAGTLLWPHLDEGAGTYFSIAEALAIDPLDSTILVAGTVRVGADAHDFLLQRFDAAGALLWRKPIERPETDDAVVAMAMDRFGLATVTGRSGDNILVMKFDYEGIVVGANLFASGYGVDEPTGVAVNRLDEAFVAGSAMNAGNNADYLVFRASGTALLPPFPFTATAGISQVNLTWSNNAAEQAGLLLQRHVGACGDAQPNWVDIVLDAAATAYAEQGVTQGGVYCYRLRAFHSNGEFSRSIYRQVTTGLPLPPDQLSATALNTTQIRLAWTDRTAGSESGYGFQIQRCAGAGCVLADADPIIATVPAPASQWIDDSLCENTAYRYRVMTKKDEVWASTWSEPLAGTNTPAKGSAPVLSASRINEKQIRLIWSDTTSDENGFILSRCVGATCTELPVAANATASVTYDDTGLAVDTIYSYQVWAYKDAINAGCSWATEYSNSASATTSLLAPTPLNATASNTTQVNMTWSDNTAHEAGFEVQRCDGDGSNCAPLFTAAANATNYSDAQLCSGDSHRYQVRAIKAEAGWPSAWALSAAVTTPPYTTPGGLNVTWVSEAQLDLSWTDSNSDESGFEIERCIDANCTVFAKPGSGSSHSDTGLEANTSYTYRVRAYKTAANGACNWSSDWSAVSAPRLTAVAAPDTLSGTVINTTQIDLSWADRTATESGFVLERCLGSTAAGCEVTLSTELPAATGTGSYQDQAACEMTTYTYRVKAFKKDALGNLLWETGWVELERTTSAAQAPTGLSLTNPDEASVVVRWGDANSDETAFAVERCSGDAAACPADASDGRFSQLTTLPAWSGGQQLFYTMDEASWGTGATVIDSSGNGRHGTPSGGASTVAAGKIGRAGAFNGSPQYVTTPLTVNQASGSPGATFEAWVYPTLQDANYRHVISTDNGGYDWSILIYNGFWYIQNGNSRYSTGKAATLNTWQHVAAVFTPASGVKFYLNGGTPYTISTIYYDTSSAPLTLGRWPLYPATANYYFFGRMDEVAIFNRPLSLAEIQAHHQTGVNSYADSSITLDTTYTYRVQAIKTVTDGCPWAKPATQTLTTIKPPKPTGLVVSRVDTSSLKLDWIDNAATNTGHRTERCQGDVATCCAGDLVACAAGADFSLLTQLGDVQTATDSDNVCKNTTYTYRVQGTRDGSAGWPSAWAWAEQTSHDSLTPGELTATLVSEDRLALAWSYAAIDLSGFKVRRCQGTAAACAGGGSWTEPQAIPQTQTSYSDAGLLPGTDYTYEVWAYKSVAGGCSWEGARQEISRKTLALPAPVNFAATPVNATTVQLSWTNLTTSETGFDICRASGGGACEPLPNSLTTGSTQFVDQTVCRDTLYTYQLAAHKKEGETLLWRTDYAQDDAQTADMVMPTGLSATRTSEVEIRVSWNDHTGDESGFWLEACTEGVTPCALIPVGASALGTVVYNHQNLQPEKIYTYRVQAYKDVPGGCNWTTAYTAPVAMTTQILAPTGLSAAAANTTQINLGWTDSNATETGFEVRRCESEGVNCTTFALAGQNITTYADTSVCNGTTAIYQVRATNPAWPLPEGASPWSSLTVPISATTIQPPSNVTATRVSEKEILVRWTDNSSDESGFHLRRCVGETCTVIDRPAVASTGIRTYNDNTLAAATTYTYQVSVFKAAPACPWESTYLPVTAVAASTNILEPSPFTATAANTTQVNLNWGDRTATETGFRIERCIGSLASCTAEELFDPLVNPNANAISAQDNSACSGTTHTYRIRAENALAPWSSAWASVAVSTPSIIVSTLAVTAVGHDLVSLQWNDATLDEEGVIVERCAGAACSDFVQIAALGANSTSYNDSTVEVSTAYRYRVRPFKAAPCPWPLVFSNEVDVLTLPAPVTDLAATALDSMTVQLQWTDHAADEEGYQVEMQMFHGLFVPIATVGPNTQSFIDSKAQPELEHRYRIRSFRGTEYSLYSNEAAVTMPAYQGGDGGCP